MDGILSAILNDQNALENRRVEQIVAICGNGTLSDDSECSTQFRSFLKNISSRILRKYADECLDGSTPRSSNSGLILQDVVNEVGERLGFSVSHGFYRGSSSRVGNDGLWISTNFSFVIEVKTSDLSVKLDNIAGYRERLIESQEIREERSSVLIVLGRQDTGDLEAQIRGSKYAWDIRLIGIDALFRLIEIKENLNDPNTIHQIVELLKPIEYTRVDKIVEIVFSTSWDISSTDEPNVTGQTEIVEVAAPPSISVTNNETRSHASPVKFYEKCIARINQKLDKHLIKNGRVTYSSPDKTTNVVLLNSKAYTDPRGKSYWYGFRPNQDEFLSSKESSFVAFGCGSENKIILIPFDRFREFIPELGTTNNEDGELVHSHVVIVESEEGFVMRVGDRYVDVTDYSI
ncbi:MAG: hypothetical protein O2954_03535 [bacterium]|nr:hypothetical protein [bacterium]